ncbi:hypothetical protein V9T40_006150 [Parthenolecanium corni]|uniref:Zinc finger CCHC-type and RNA-binding motif-containing protein 1 n=1 Tax=Parthenolecanium corni TaxID=536013 RepID=A0AAN9U2U2_9HEMI
MSHGLAPSKSTVYVSNLPFSLTNNDLHKMFEQYGKIVKVTVLKDKQTRESKGVAFVLFLREEEALNFVSSFDRKQIGGRTIRVKIAADNGRSSEFIRKKIYKDKTKCYECGEEGHLSYECPKNTLGYRKPPPKKKKKRNISDSHNIGEYLASSDDDYMNSPIRKKKYEDDDSHSEETEEPDLETLSAAIQFEQEKYSMETEAGISGHNFANKKRIRKSAYFSDEEELSD